ncbi:MAG: hypothetical protein H7287_03400, partial [Thermoleophilia bacterium]|nr:hypothetical protein [Thermoleophilia bacterium]
MLVGIDLVVALAIIGIIVWSVSVGDAPQLRTKAMSVRAVLYPLSLFIVP